MKKLLFAVLLFWAAGVFAQTNVFSGNIESSGGSIYAPTTPPTAPQIDASGQPGISVATGSNSALTGANGAFAEYLVFLGAYATTGDVAEYICGNSACLMLGSVDGSFVASTTTPASGKFSVAYNSANSTFNVYNNEGATVVFAAFVVRLH